MEAARSDFGGISEQVLTAGPLEVRLDQRTVLADGRGIVLTVREFHLLAALASLALPRLFGHAVDQAQHLLTAGPAQAAAAHGPAVEPFSDRPPPCRSTRPAGRSDRRAARSGR